jgi:Na+-transporting methylmalonyl-CoA/oxaloacetate decarboxylase beta subunit
MEVKGDIMKNKTAAIVVAVCAMVATLGLVIRHLWEQRGDAVSIGVIGEADGPTALFVSGQRSDLLAAMGIAAVILIAVLCAIHSRRKLKE